MLSQLVVRLKRSRSSISTDRVSWPTEVELDLLRAGLLEDERAQRAWDRWRAATGGVAGETALRLLPLVEWNLTRIARPAALAGREPGFVETGWLGNEKLLEQAATVLRSLEREGIRPLLIKGIALSEQFYPHRALRPIGDMDLLVGSERLFSARRIIEDLGWQPKALEPASRVSHLHAVAYEGADRPELDLHAHALLECLSPDADDGFFARAVPLEVAGCQAATLSPADHLLCVCVHGLRWSDVPAVHWAADAVMIVRRAGESLVWETLVVEARRRNLSLWVERALRLIQTAFDAPVPRKVLVALSRDAAGWRQKFELAARMRPPSLGRGLFLHWCGLARELPGTSAAGRLARFPRYLRELWGLDHGWQLPFVAARKSLLRLVASLRGT